MKTVDINTSIIDGYLKLLGNLSIGNKLDLIAKLTLSAKKDIAGTKDVFRQSFGAFQSSKSAEEIISEIRASRTFTRKIEEI